MVGGRCEESDAIHNSLPVYKLVVGSKGKERYGGR